MLPLLSRPSTFFLGMGCQPGTKTSGTVDLSQALFISLNIEDAGFNVGTLGRTYNFKAESAQVAIDWVEHLNQVVVS